MHGAALPWIPGPHAGVDRRPLYRVGGEQAGGNFRLEPRSWMCLPPGENFEASAGAQDARLRIKD